MTEFKRDDRVVLKNSGVVGTVAGTHLWNFTKSTYVLVLPDEEDIYGKPYTIPVKDKKGDIKDLLLKTYLCVFPEELTHYKDYAEEQKKRAQS
jgi:hypothetical protein